MKSSLELLESIADDLKYLYGPESNDTMMMNHISDLIDKIESHINELSSEDSSKDSEKS